MTTRNEHAQAFLDELNLLAGARRLFPSEEAHDAALVGFVAKEFARKDIERIWQSWQGLLTLIDMSLKCLRAFDWRRQEIKELQAARDKDRDGWMP